MARLLIGLLCLLVLSCIPVPIREIRGVSGKGKSQDVAFIKEGQTRREEVASRLAWMDSGIGESRLFWGRWTSSSVVLVGGVPGAVGGVRPRSIHNLFIEFDERGIVTRSRPIAESDVVGELLAWWRGAGRTPVEHSTIASMNVRHANSEGRFVDATLRARGESLELRGVAGGPPRITMTEVLRISASVDHEKTPGLMSQSVLYRDGLDKPEQITLQIEPRDLYTLLRYAASSDANVPVPSLRAPTLVSPADGVVLNARTATLRWTPTPRAIAYIVQQDYRSNGAWRSETLDFPEYDTMVPRTSHTVDLFAGRTARWRVWPVNEAGARGVPSEWRTFSTP